MKKILNSVLFAALFSVIGVSVVNAELFHSDDVYVTLVNSTTQNLKFLLHEQSGDTESERLAPGEEDQEDLDGPVISVDVEIDRWGRNLPGLTYQIPADLIGAVNRIEAIEDNGNITLELNDDSIVLPSNDQGAPMDIDDDNDDNMEIDE